MRKLYLTFVYFLLISCNHSLKEENLISVEESENTKEINNVELEEEVQHFKELREGDTMYVNDAEVLQDYMNSKRHQSDFGKFNSKKFIIQSKFNDKEINGNVIQTNKEITYHTFDFKNKTVTLKTPLNGKYLSYKYPIKGFYTEKGKLATTYVILVETLGVQEIWFSLDVPNLGYDFDDGSRIACYDLTQLY